MKQLRKPLILGAILLWVAGVTVLTVSADNSKSDAKRAPAQDGEGFAPSETEVQAERPKRSTSKGCLADNLAIEDIQRTRDELDAKTKELAAKEAELKSRETILEEELKKIDEAQKQVKQTEELLSKKNEEKINKIVETVENMPPKGASQLMANLDESLAVVAMSRVSTLKLAKIMNLMDPVKASKLTELLAGVVRAKKSQTKGGEKYDGLNQNNATHAANPSSQREPSSKK